MRTKGNYYLIVKASDHYVVSFYRPCGLFPLGLLKCARRPGIRAPLVGIFTLPWRLKVARWNNSKALCPVWSMPACCGRMGIATLPRAVKLFRLLLRSRRAWRPAGGIAFRPAGRCNLENHDRKVSRDVLRVWEANPARRLNPLLRPDAL